MFLIMRVVVLRSMSFVMTLPILDDAGQLPQSRQV